MAQNTPPTHAQIREVQTLLEQGREELSQLDATIFKLSLVLSQLTLQRKRRVESLAALGRVLCPIRRVPPEILSEIFRWYTRMNSDAGEGRRVSNVRGLPLLLGHVCSIWRHVSQNTPYLWNDVCLFGDALSAESMLAVVRLILQRSGALPVTMELASFQGDAEHRLVPMFELRTRLQHLNLHLLANNTLITQTKAFPILKAGWLRDLGGMGGTRLEDVLSIWQNAPCLQTLELNSVQMSLDIADSRFPWSQLTTLTLVMPISALATREILLRCTQLESCSFHLIEPAALELPASPPCTRGNLHTLEFRGTPHGGVAWEAFIQPFTLPGLQTLTLSDFHCSAHAFSQFISRSQFKLHSLTLMSVSPLESEDIIPLLRQLPTLHTLEVHYMCSDIFFHAFTYVTGSTPPLTLPSLQKLTIQESTDGLDDEDGDAVAAMVESLARNAGRSLAPDGNPYPFPAMSSLALALEGARFSTAVERRLADAVATGFLADTIARF
ncbi:hypothetical protein C8R46DRAFT_1197216 [Mycena filopes]|nr:hypothetical protein C8R46DRAFT_1197216 [Mycena filopes]